MIRQIFSANQSIDTTIMEPQLDQSYHQTLFFSKRVNKSVIRNNNDKRGRIMIISQQQQQTRSATPMTQSTSSSNSSKAYQRVSVPNPMSYQIHSTVHHKILDKSYQQLSSLDSNQQKVLQGSKLFRNYAEMNRSTQYQIKQIGSSFRNEKMNNLRFGSPLRFNRVLLKLKIRRIEDLSELYLEQYNKQLPQQKKTCIGQRDLTIRQLSKDGILKINADFLLGHQISRYQRSKMVDWMFLVFSKFNKSETSTIFVAADILDQYLKIKQGECASLNISDLHLYGLTSIFMSSKINDVVPIYLKELIEAASHNVFTANQIKNAEQDILKGLQFQINQSTLFDQTSVRVKEIFLRQKQGLFKDSLIRMNTEQKDLESLIELLSKLSLLDFGLCMLSSAFIVDGIIISAIGIQIYLKQQEQQQIFQSNDQKFQYQDILNYTTFPQPVDKLKDSQDLLKDLINDYTSNHQLIHCQILTPIIKGLLKQMSKLIEGKLKFKTLIELYPQYSKLHLDTNSIINLIQQYLK